MQVDADSHYLQSYLALYCLYNSAVYLQKSQKPADTPLHSQESDIHKLMYALNLKEAIDKSTTHNDNDMNLNSLHECK